MDPGISLEELQLARNHGLPLEALAYDVTPVGLHYLLVHYALSLRRGRSRDEAGNEQPVDPPWGVGDYANNAVQRVPVTVRP